MRASNPLLRWFASLLLTIAGTAGCAQSGTGNPASLTAPSSLIGITAESSSWVGAVAPLGHGAPHGDKVWICHFTGHMADGTGEIFYDGPDRVIGQGEAPDGIGCELRGGQVLNVGREACANGHDAQPLAGTCEG